MGGGGVSLFAHKLQEPVPVLSDIAIGAIRKSRPEIEHGEIKELSTE